MTIMGVFPANRFHSLLILRMGAVNRAVFRQVRRMQNF